MNRNLLIGAAVGALSVTAIATIAGTRWNTSEGYAEVIAVQPVLKTVSEPRQSCREEVVDARRPAQDSSRTAGTIPEKIQEADTERQLQQVCETVYATRQVPESYRVTYELDGREYTVNVDARGRRLVENGSTRFNAKG
jgi:uncharacterized protein YcfJ